MLWFFFFFFQHEHGCGSFKWKDEIDNEKNLAAMIEDMKKMMDRQNEILWAAVEKIKHASEERKKSNKGICLVMFLCCLMIVICMLKILC